MVINCSIYLINLIPKLDLGLVTFVPLEINGFVQSFIETAWDNLKMLRLLDQPYL